MTVGDLLHLAWRHWVVSILALVVIAGGVVWAHQRHDAYNGQVAVLLLAPVTQKGNALVETSRSLVATTGVVAVMVNGAGTSDQTVGDQTLASLGVQAGWSVRQPSSGGQWELSFSDPELDVRSTGPTLDVAQSEMATALARIDEALKTLQDREGVLATHRVRAVLNPNEPVFTRQTGSPTRAMGVVGVLGLLGWGAALLAVERVRRPAYAALPERAAALASVR